MSDNVQIDPITQPVQHAEGPFWDHKNNILYYVDTFTATVLRFNTNSNTTTSHKIPNRNSIAIVVPLRDTKNEFILGADRYLYRFIWDGKENNTGKLQEVLMVEQEKTSNQFNDGKADRRGRLWIGSLTRNSDKSVSSNGGALYKITGGGGNLKYITKIPNTSISNGIAWTKDNKRFYFIDSETRLIVGWDFHEKHGDISNGKTVFNLENHKELTGIPDGMTIDSEDNLWVALFGGGAVIKVNPKSGKLERIIKLPVTYVTSTTFGGPNFEVLYVTTSRLKLDDSGLKSQPLAGSVFAITNLGVRGLAPNEFSLKGTCQDD